MTRGRTAAGVFTLIAAIALPLHVSSAQTRSSNDYLLGRPRVSLNVRIGADRPLASDGVFAFAQEQLTLNPNDYTALNFGADLGVPLTQRLELQFSTSSAGRRVQSEYRDLIGSDDLPIEQSTRLRRMPVSAGVRYNLVPAGRVVSRLAWVPAKVVPYVSAGGGAMWYRFQQQGEFVDYRSPRLDVFRANLEASGWAPLAYAATGFTWTTRPAVSLNTELRYDHSRAPMRGDFTGFDNTALSGVALTTGVQFRF